MRARGARFAAIALVLLAAGCGGGAEPNAQAPAAAEQQPALETPAAEIAAKGATSEVAGHEATSAQSHAGHSAALPDVQVVRVTKGGAKVNLQSLHTAGKPTLLWFWAPHCTFCRAEAPKLVDFSAKHGSKIAVLGLGAQDDLRQAEGFCTETSTTPLEMVWDASGKSWVHYKVTNQPTVIVLDADGKVVKRWFREFDEREILEAAGQA
ncbi:MAG: TlpA family protein disulfide reductase [Sporichthyaceae bacterium]